MKREKLFRALILLFSAGALIYAFSGMDFGMSSQYADLLVDEDTFNALLEDREALEDPVAPELYFNDYALPHDALTDTYLYSLIEEHPNSLDPQIRSVTDDFRRYEVAIYIDILNPDSIAENQAATVVLYTDDYYKTYSLKATTLPIVTLSMQEKADDRNNPVGMEDSLAQLELFDNRQEASMAERVIKSQTYIRLRGATSLRFPKNQFRLNLREFSISGVESNNHLSLLGLREDDDWILYSGYNDPERMRNTLSNNLWHDVMGENNPFDINTGTEGKFVEVFIDGKYWGIYTLLYPIDAKGLELNRNPSPESDFYYRTYSHRPFELEDFTSDQGLFRRGRFELRDPENNGKAFQWVPLVDHMLSLEYPMDDMHAYLEDSSYLPNLIDYFLFYVLLQATDNDTKNHNYIAKHTDKGHIMIESPWDLDLTWGLRWNENHPRLSEVTREVTQNPLPRQSHVTRAIEQGDQTVITMVQDRYSELRASDWSEDSLMARLDSYEAAVYASGASSREQARWPEAAYNPDASELRQYVSNRLQVMDEFLDALLGGEESND